MKKEEHKQEIKLDALKLIAESYGFELVEKKREPKLGDFGKFWDNGENNCCYDFLKTIDIDDVGTPYETKFGTWYRNFAHLTEEEKKQIQENW